MSVLTRPAERRWLLWPPLLFLALGLGVPVAVLIAQSLGGEGGFATVFGMPAFGAAVLRTVLMALVVAVVTLAFGLGCALGIWASPRWLQWALLGLLFVSLWTSVMVRSFGWVLLEIPRGVLYWLLSSVGLAEEPLSLYQTAFAMYPAMVSVMLPFAVLPIVAALRTLDGDQLRAARSLGAGGWLTLRAVILPAVRPSLIAAATLVLVMSLGFYVTPLLLGGPANQTLSGLIALQLGAVDRPEAAAAMSLLLVGGTVALYLTADRLFRVSEHWGMSG